VVELGKYVRKIKFYFKNFGILLRILYLTLHMLEFIRLEGGSYWFHIRRRGSLRNTVARDHGMSPVPANRELSTTQTPRCCSEDTK